MKRELILGPPGTGKTTTLINRVSDLLDSGVAAERIAYVSFTRKAAEEARDRARERFDLPKNSFQNFRTLHSLAYRELGLSQGDVMTPTHWQEISDLTGAKLTANGFDDGVGTDKIVAFHLHLAKVLGRGYEEHFRMVAGSQRSRAFNFGALHRGGGLQQFVALGDYIDTYKDRLGIVDFSDMLSLGQHVEPIDCDFAIIDEAQDLSPLQWRFVKNIFKNAKSITIAGDDDQAIYSWAGADLHTFRNMEARRTILDQSWRCPQTVWQFANAIVEQIEDRYQKHWEPREEAGQVDFINSLSECPLENGESWYLLTRTKAQQQKYVHYLRGAGFTYRKNGVHSIKSDHLALARTWTRLLKGEPVSVAQIRSLYANMTADKIDPAGAAKLDLLDDDSRLTIGTVAKDYGLKVQAGVWHEVVIIDANDSRYYRTVKERTGVQSLVAEPTIEVSTIHAVKGGEADNVVFSSSMGQRPYRNFRAGYTRDDEARIFYVAATRAKKRLYVKLSLQCSYPIPSAAYDIS